MVLPRLTCQQLQDVCAGDGRGSRLGVSLGDLGTRLAWSEYLKFPKSQLQLLLPSTPLLLMQWSVRGGVAYLYELSCKTGVHCRLQIFSRGKQRWHRTQCKFHKNLPLSVTPGAANRYLVLSGGRATLIGYWNGVGSLKMVGVRCYVAYSTYLICHCNLMSEAKFHAMSNSNNPTSTQEQCFTQTSTTQSNDPEQRFLSRWHILLAVPMLLTNVCVCMLEGRSESEGELAYLCMCVRYSLLLRSLIFWQLLSRWHIL